MRTQKIIWLAIAFSTVLYFVIAYMLFPNPEGSVREKVEQPMVIGLYGMAALMFIVASLLPSRIAKAQAALIVSLGLYESCAIFGLLCAFLQQDWRLYIAPWALALLGFMRVFPSAETATDPG